MPSFGQEPTYEQRIADLDAKATALSERLEDSEARAKRFNSFIEQAKARLKELRAKRTTVDPIHLSDKSLPFPPAAKPSPPIVEPDKGKPVGPPIKPRSKKGYYIQTFGGFLMPRTVSMKTNIGKIPIEPKEGFSTGLVFGRDFGRFRLEGEISGRKYNHDTMDLSDPSLQGPGFSKTPVSGYSKTLGGIVTALWDIQLAENFGLCLGVGTGVNGATLKLENLNFKDTLFVYQLLTGFEWAFTENASARFLYKYFTTAGNKDFDRLDSHNLELGLQVDL